MRRSARPAASGPHESIDEVIRRIVREEIERASATTDPLVKLTEELPVSAARACAIGRSGAIAGCSRVGRTFVAPRSAIRAWLEANAPKRDEVAGVDDVDRDLKRLGLGGARAAH